MFPVNISNEPRNRMVARTCVYLLVLSSLRVPWCIEQPASSLLEAHPLFSYLLKKFTIYRAAWLVSHIID